MLENGAGRNPGALSHLWEVVAFPTSFRFSVVLCLLSAGTAAGVDLRLVEPAAAETPNRSRDGGGRAREAHICLGDLYLPGISPSRKWFPCPTCAALELRYHGCFTRKVI